jgi:hypothetical protein
MASGTFSTTARAIEATSVCHNAPVYRAAAASIASDPTRCQASPASPDVNAENDCAAEPNSAATPSHAAEAASIGAEPVPASSNDETTSGGDTKKLTGESPSRPQRPPAPHLAQWRPQRQRLQSSWLTPQRPFDV